MKKLAATWVQLATRVPQSLHRSVKVHCVRTDRSVMAFVTDALREKLDRGSAGRRGRYRFP